MVWDHAICEFIEARQIIEFYYDQSLRRVEPHLLGVDRDGDVTLSAWQLEGGSGQGWRDFHVSKLTKLRPTEENFLGARPGFDPKDKTLDRILCHL